MYKNIYDKKYSEYGISKFPEDPVVAMAYIPYQQVKSVYSAEQGLSSGTMFPCLDKPFKGCRGNRNE